LDEILSKDEPIPFTFNNCVFHYDTPPKNDLNDSQQSISDDRKVKRKEKKKTLNSLIHERVGQVAAHPSFHSALLVDNRRSDEEQYLVTKFNLN
jgi:hypothetical protein